MEVQTRSVDVSEITESCNAQEIVTVEEKEILHLEPNHPSMESPLKFENDRCTCCPYGYHVDVDFVRFCDALASGSYLRRLKKIKRTKRKLRKSMEIYLQQHSSAAVQTHDAPQHLPGGNYHKLSRSDSDSSTVLDEIDSSVNATISSIDHMIMNPGMTISTPSQQMLRSENAVEYSRSKSQTLPRGHKIRSGETVMAQLNTQLNRNDSVSSLSSESTVSSEKSSPYTPNSSIDAVPHSDRRQLHTVSIFAQTKPKSVQETFTAQTTTLNDTGVNVQQVNTLDQQTITDTDVSHSMDVTLKRLKDLEEQVKVIPVLQVRLSVMKEEKRLLQLQMKAKNSKLNTRSIGVGYNNAETLSSNLDDLQTSLSPTTLSSISSPASTPSHSTLAERFEFMRRTGHSKAPVKLPTKTVGVGNHDIDEPYLLQPNASELTWVEQKIFQSYRPADVMASSSPRHEVGAHDTSNELSLQTASLAFAQSLGHISPRTRTHIQGAEDRSYDALDSNLHIHEKELQTVILGQATSVVPKRNVGVECKVSTRDVGVSYVFDEAKPFMKSVGVGDNNVFEQNQVIIKESDFKNVLHEVLSKNVRSIGVNCNIERSMRSIGIMHSPNDTRSVAVGDDTIDVVVKAFTLQKSIGVSTTPNVRNIGTLTDRGWRVDSSVNTDRIYRENKYTSTDILRNSHAATMTDPSSVFPAGTQTMKVYISDEPRDKVIQLKDNTIYMEDNVIKSKENAIWEETKVSQVVTPYSESRNMTIKDFDKWNEDHINERPLEVTTSLSEYNSQTVTTDNSSTRIKERAPIRIRTSPTKEMKQQAKADVDSMMTALETAVKTHSLQTSSPPNIRRSETRRIYEPYTKHMSDRAIANQSRYVSKNYPTQHSTTLRPYEIVEESTTVVNTVKIPRKIDGASRLGDYSSSISTNNNAFTDGLKLNDETLVKESKVTEVGRKVGPGSPKVMRAERDASTVGVSSLDEISKDTESIREETSNNGYLVIDCTQSLSDIDSFSVDSFSSDVKSPEIIESSVLTVESDSHIKDFDSSLSPVSKVEKSVTNDFALHEAELQTSRVRSGGRTSSDWIYPDADDVVMTTEEYYVTGNKIIPISEMSKEEYSAFRSGNLSTVLGDVPSFMPLKLEVGEQDHKESSADTSITKTKKINSKIPHFDALSRKSDKDSLLGRSFDLSSSAKDHTKSRKSDKDSVIETSFDLSSSAMDHTKSRKSDKESLLQTSFDLSSSAMDHTKSRKSDKDSLLGTSFDLSSSTMDHTKSRKSDKDSLLKTSFDLSSSALDHTKSRKSDRESLLETSFDLPASTTHGAKSEVIRNNDKQTSRDISTLKSISTPLSDSFDMTSRSDFDFSASDAEYITETVETVTTYKKISPLRSFGSDFMTTSFGEREKNANIFDLSASADSAVVTSDISRTLSKNETNISTSRDSDSIITSEASMSDRCADINVADSGMATSFGSEAATSGDDSSISDLKPLKSCMKRSASSESQVKKEITFSHSLISKHESRDASGIADDDRTALEDDSDDTDSDSASSYDEGSYDGREGSIVYTCGDDEAIAQGTPGAAMFDQNIRETFEISGEMKDSCRLLADYLVDSTTVQAKHLNAALKVIQVEWFKVAGNKLSDVYMVEDYLSSFNEISKRLIQYIVNIADNSGNTVLHYAVTNGNLDLVGLLLDTEVADVGKQNTAGYSPVMLVSISPVASDKQLAIVRRMFKLGDINAMSSQAGQTALMLAVSHGRTHMVKLLLEVGAEINTQDEDGSTALMCACEHGFTEIVSILLNDPKCDANITDNDGSTALSIAMEAGHRDIGVLLYAHLNFSKQPSPGVYSKKRFSPLASPVLSSLKK